MNVIVIRFITLDGVVSLPDESGSTPADGRAFRPAQQAGAVVLARYGRATR